MPVRPWISAALKHEATSGILLLLAAVVAIMVSSSTFAPYCTAFFATKIIHEPITYWINEGLMSIFFLHVGMEIKEELIEGELNTVKKALLPGIAALGGMLIPAAIFLMINIDHPQAHLGWPISVSTDIAFSLGVLKLMGRRVPISLKLFLLALAIFDDLGAIVIIAVFFTQEIHGKMLIAVFALISIFTFLNYIRFRHLTLYLALGFGFILWILVSASGVDATIAGVTTAFFIPLKDVDHSPLKRLHHQLTPIVNYIILPLFAFTNAGISIEHFSINNMLKSLPLGIFCALVIGKPLGVTLFSWFAVRCKIAVLPTKTTWRHMIGVGFLCGIGFTMSLLLAELAFGGKNPLQLELAKFGVLMGSASAIVLSFIWFNLIRSFKRVSP